MAWELATRFLRLAGEPAGAELDTSAADPLEFPAGVVGLGRGGAGAIGALVREDGEQIGMLCLAGRCERGRDDVAALAESLPLGACQFLTVRWPVDASRAGAGWRALARGRAAGSSLAALIAERHLPSLVDAGWSEVRSLLVLARPDAGTLHRDLLATAAALPIESRPATLEEVKLLAGDWFLPHVDGDVTIGWSVTELTAEPPADWARQILEDSVLAGVPTMLSLHLAPAGAPEPVSLAMRRQMQELDAAIESRRRRGELADDLLAERRELMAALAPAAPPAGVGSRDARPRPARLLIACAVPSESARAVRDEVEPVLHRLGLRFVAHGPRLSRDLHLSCAPLATSLVGRGMTLTGRGAALLAPLVPTTIVRADGQARGLPLGLRRDGAALWPLAGEGLLLTGAPEAATALAQSWAAGAVAQGANVLVVATRGGWEGVATAVDGEVVPIALNLGAALATLGAAGLRHQAGTSPERQIGAWAAAMTDLLTDLCPDLAEDDLGDLTATLLGLAEGALAWGEPLRLQAVIAQLQQGGEAARHLATLLLSTAGGDAPRPGDPLTALLVHDADPDRAGERVAPPAGCAAVALRALLDRLAGEHPDPRARRIIVIDDLTAMLEGLAGEALVRDLLAEARRVGATVWCVASSLAACPRELLAEVRDLAATLVAGPDAPEALRLLARTLDLPTGALDGLAQATVGEVVVVRGEGAGGASPVAVPIRTLPLAMGGYGAR